jgi:D-arabinose 1-dehydrogenase-like Zn-dependent alcohol dehydrogenase
LIDGYFSLGGDAKLDLATLGFPIPITLGHETTAEVVSMGEQASAKVGQRVIVYPWIGCGTCRYCKSGDEELCPQHNNAPLGTASNGGFSNYILVPHQRYLVDYTGVPDDVAATFACSGLTAMSAVKKFHGHVSPTDKLLIVGAGGVGFSAIKIAQALYGADSLLVADIDAKRLAEIETMGIKTINNSGDSMDVHVAKILAETTGGVAGVVDFVGNTPSFELCVGSLRKGGKVVVVGLFGGAATISLPLLPLRSITIQGSYVGNLKDFQELVEMGKQGKLPPIPTSARPLAEAQTAVEDLRAGKVIGRLILKP